MHQSFPLPIARPRPAGAGFAPLCEALWRIETDLSLLTRTVGGVHYWPLLRLEALGRIARARLYAPIGGHGPGWGARIARHALDAAADAPPLLFERFGRLDGVYIPDVVPGPREHFNFPIHGLGLDRDPEIERLLILYRTNESVRTFPRTRHIARRITSIADAGTAIGYATAGRFLGAMSGERRMLNELFRSELDTDFPLDARAMALAVARFSARRRLMAALLKRVGAPRLFVVDSYCMSEWVAAGHDVGMEVVELQHGLITPYHLGYSYPGRPFVPYAPDRLLLFGPYWEKAADLPSNTRATVIGSAYLDCYKAARVAKTPRLAVVISQGVIGPALFDAIASIAGRVPEWEFRFRAHPGEPVAGYAARLAGLANRPANLTISPPSEDFSTLLCRAEVQIGVFSTGLFEGMGSGTRTILLLLPGIEYMDEVLKRGEAALARNAGEIADLLQTAPACSDPAKYYSAPVRSIAAALRAG